MKASSQDLFKGYPEFRVDQPRGNDGRWSGGGGTRRSRSRNAIRYKRVEWKGIDWKAVDPKIGLVQEKGAGRAGKAVKKVMSRLTFDQQYILKNVPKKAVYDMARYAEFLGQNPNRKDFVYTAGFFSPPIGIVVGEGWTNNKYGFIEFDSIERWAAHEMGHAFDFYAIPGQEFGFSGALAGTIMSEYNNLSASQRYYSEHYGAEDLTKELFADVFAAVYGGPGEGKWKGKEYIGYSLSRQGVLNRFPRTVAAIKNWELATKPTVKSLFKGYPEYRPDQPRGKGGKWVKGPGSSDATTADRRRDQRRKRDRETRQRKERESRRLQPKQEQRNIRVRAEPGTDRAVEAIKDTMARIPRSHFEVLKNMPMVAMYDMRPYAALNQKIDPEKGRIQGFFSPMTGLVVGEGWSNKRFGFVPFEDTYRVAIHETAHAFDYYAVPGEEFAVSRALWPTMRADLESAPRSFQNAIIQYYTAAYEPSEAPKEMFAEIYTAAYGRPTSGKYLFNLSMTQQQVLTTFSRSVAALRSIQ